MVRLKKAGGGKEAPIKIPSKKIDGVLTRVNGVNFEIPYRHGPAQAPIKSVDAGELNKLLTGWSFPGGILSSRISGWRSIARTRRRRRWNERCKIRLRLRPRPSWPVRCSMQESACVGFQQVATSGRLGRGLWKLVHTKRALRSGKLRRRRYDAPSRGDWRTVSGQECADQFDFDLSSMKSGYAFIFEFGSDEQHTISAVFSAAGLSLNSTIGNAASTPDPLWRAGSTTHVDISIKGDTFSVNAGGKVVQTLQVQGLSDVNGTISFRARETACQIGR